MAGGLHISWEKKRMLQNLEAVNEESTEKPN
jgi:hypothetical protein